MIQEISKSKRDEKWKIETAESVKSTDRTCHIMQIISLRERKKAICEIYVNCRNSTLSNVSPLRLSNVRLVDVL